MRCRIARYAGLADLPLAPDLADVEFVPRLLHAGREQFGIVVEIIIGAISRALAEGHPALGVQDFARFYTERTGDGAVRNPFLVPDFRSVSTGRSPLEPDPSASPKGQTRKPKGRR